MVRPESLLRRSRPHLLGQRLQLGPAPALHFGGTGLQPVEELGELLLHLGLGPQAGVGGDRLPAPSSQGACQRSRSRGVGARYISCAASSASASICSGSSLARPGAWRHR